MRWMFLGLAIVGFGLELTESVAAQEKKADEKVSYYKQVRPIFQAHCQGCHQPAKSRGEYIMTSHAKLLGGGDSGRKAVVPGKAAGSYLVELITPRDGKAAMPEGKKPLDIGDIDLIKKWIDQGATDDTPANAQHKFDADHPPVYTYPPVITSLDFSPDGKLLAVAGFHEVLLIDAETHALAGRLVGMSERIQSVRFSPDGKRLAVSGGLPGRMGEIQVWDPAKRILKLSTPVTFDTLFGVSWSSDGKQLAFGCTDNSVRVISASNGEQVMFQGGHSDWVLDTFFTADNSHVVSASRDMSVKLTEIATQRLVDNVTSITPGALKGGVQALGKHPKLNLFVTGGSDGMPRVYRVHRETARMIGDDANLIGDLFQLTGRIFSVRFSADGKKIVAGSSLDGKGEILVTSYDHVEDVPGPIKAIMGKVPGARNPQENKALKDYRDKGIRLFAHIKVDGAGIYAVALRPDGNVVAAAGGDGKVRLYEAASGKLLKDFSPAPIQTAATATKRPNPNLVFPKDEPLATEKLPDAKVIALEIEPKTIVLKGPYTYAQLLITARLSDGNSFDATRVAKYQGGPMIEITPSGLVRPRSDGAVTIQIDALGHKAAVPVQVVGVQVAYDSDFLRDINPILGRLGCNAGTCHGANKGKNGFKLSLRGGDAILDVRSFLDDHAGRRANVASPDDSLMLLKATGAVPHVGGQLTRPGEPYYELIRNWIARGAKLDMKTPRVKSIDIQPRSPIVQRAGDKQQFRVLATYADGAIKDVTRESFIEVGNIELASADKTGLLTALRRGEVPVLARFEGAYTATTLLVMGDRTGFVWKDPPAFNKIDELTAAKWKRMKIQPSELSDDLTFLRRVHIDLTGVPPTVEDIKAFTEDKRETRAKREAVVDKLLGNADYVDYWTNKWADLLTVNRKYLGPEGASAFRTWIKKEVAANTPYDVMARKILTATGSNKDNPPASYFKILRDATNTMENTTHLFLGVRFNCNKCHDHPFERWTQDQYYETASFFARFDLRPDPASAGKTVGGTAVVGGKPLYEIVVDKNDGEVKHDRTGAYSSPKFPYPAKHQSKDKASRREELAAWMTSPDNLYFAKSYVNRMWGYLFGAGIIDPIDDIRAGNPPTNPELLDYLTQEFIKSHFNVRHIQRLIVTSHTYQLSMVANKWNEDDRTNYSRSLPRRLPAEVLYDAILKATGSTGKLGGRAAALPDSGVDLPSGFLATFGRPARDSACECERSSGMQLGPVMALVSGSTLAEAINDPANAIVKLTQSEKDDDKLIEQLFVRVLNRPPTKEDIAKCLAVFQEVDVDHQKLTAALKLREQEVVAIKAKQDKERLDNIAKAKADLETYQKAMASKVSELEKARQSRIQTATAALQKYETTLPEQAAGWAKKQNTAVEWNLLTPEKPQAPKTVTLTVLPDRSIMASGKAGRDGYTITYQTSLKNITAVRLEMIADPKLPKSGPGRAGDGNFVLTEFQVLVQPNGSKELPRKIALVQPLADFSQTNYDVKFAVDGDERSRDKGWAVSPATGVTHWATFQLKEPIQFHSGAIITVKLNSEFQQPAFVPGRFRVSFATAKDPVGLSIADEYGAIIKTPEASRSPEQKKALLAYFRLVDGQLQNLRKALGAAQAPLPADPKLQELQNTLNEVSRPVPEDERLIQLRRDVAQSTQQLANRRLTAAQDIAWALINSPAFLFNH